MAQLFTNNAESTVPSGIAQGETSLVLATGKGAAFPSLAGDDFFLGTLFEKDDAGNETRMEVVRVTARSSDVLTITRDFEGMTGSSGGYIYPSSDGKAVYFELRWTAYAANNSMQKSENLAGITDAVAARTNLGLGNVDNTSDATVLAAAAEDATEKSNTAISASAPIGHVGSGGSEHANVVAAGSSGFMSGTDKSKLDGISDGANAYEHPANHLPSIITQDSSNRFVSDAEKSSWNGKQDVLVSGENIKTIGGVSIIGIGNIQISPSQGYFYARDEKPSGSSGGACIANTWEIRELNTVVDNSIAGASLSSNSITLPAGKYRIEARFPIYGTGLFRGGFYNNTDSSFHILSNVCNSSVHPVIQGNISIDVQKVFSIRQISNAAVGNGFGYGFLAAGEIEIFARVEIWQLS